MLLKEFVNYFFHDQLIYQYAYQCYCFPCCSLVDRGFGGFFKDHMFNPTLVLRENINKQIEQTKNAKNNVKIIK